MRERIQEALKNHWERYRSSVINTHGYHTLLVDTKARNREMDREFNLACQDAGITANDRRQYTQVEYLRGVEAFGEPSSASEIRQRVHAKLGKAMYR